MYSIKKSAAGRRIGIFEMTAAFSFTGRAGPLLYAPGGDAREADPALMYGFRLRHRRKEVKK
jgi:hypothetical protein